MKFEQPQQPEKGPERLPRLQVGSLLISKSGTIRKISRMVGSIEPTSKKPIGIIVAEKLKKGKYTASDTVDYNDIINANKAGFVKVIPPGEQADEIWREAYNKIEEQENAEIKQWAMSLEMEPGNYLVAADGEKVKILKIVTHPEFGGGGMLLIEDKHKVQQPQETQITFKELRDNFSNGQYLTIEKTDKNEWESD